MRHVTYGLFEAHDTLCVVIDIQEKLTPVMSEENRVIHKANTLISGMHALGIPILITEQYPKGLGHTDKRIRFEPTNTLCQNKRDMPQMSEVRDVSSDCKLSSDSMHLNTAQSQVPHARVLEKISFSIFGDEIITQEIAALNVSNLIICGIESHICVLQSVLHALELGFCVWVAGDALSSRDRANHENALDLMARSSARVSNVESILFGAMLHAKDPSFKPISTLIK